MERSNQTMTTRTLTLELTETEKCDIIRAIYRMLSMLSVDGVPLPIIHRLEMTAALIEGAWKAAGKESAGRPLPRSD